MKPKTIEEFKNTSYSKWDNEALIEAIRDARDSLRLAIKGGLKVQIYPPQHADRLISVRPYMNDWFNVVDDEWNGPVCTACLAGCYYLGKFPEHIAQLSDLLEEGEELDLGEVIIPKSNNITWFLDKLRDWRWQDTCRSWVPSDSRVRETLERLGLRSHIDWDEEYEYREGDSHLVLEMLDRVLDLRQQVDLQRT